MIRTVVFDMGGVLLRFDPAYFVEKVGVSDPADRQLLLREVYQTTEWGMMDRGTLTEAQGLAIFQSRLPERLHEAARRLTVDWQRPILPVPGMAELVRALHEAGYGIYLLSNAAYGQKNYWHDIPGSEYFDGTLISAEEKLCKPQPEIYKLLCSRFGLVPKECVFIDDSVPNCEGAVFSGYGGAFVFHGDAAELAEKLRGIGVKFSL